jgi:mannitol operon transcriptional antiterminator
MGSLDSRSIRIINALLDANTVKSTAEIADRLGISTKKVRYRLDRVSAWLADHDVVFHKEFGRGIWLEGDHTAFRKLEDHLKEINGYELILTPGQRQQILVYTLLQEDKPVIAKELELALGVSRSTLFSDLDHATEWLESYSIILVRKPGFGIQLSGKEGDKRQALVDLVIEHLEQDKLMYALFGGSQNISLTNPAFICIASSPIVIFLNSLQSSLAYQMLTNIEKQVDIQFSDYSTLILLLHICIMIVRIAQDHPILNHKGDIEQLTKHPYFSAVLQELRPLGRKLNIPISLEEICALFSRMLDMEIYPISSDHTTYNLEEMHILDLITESLAEVDDLIGNPRLSENSQIVHELTLIFEPFLDRLHLNFNIKNPLLDEFTSIHPDLYHAAEIIGENLSLRTGREIPPDEIGYIGMCLYSAMKKVSSFPKTKILIICPMGAITSHLLAERIKTEFPNLEIIDVLSIRKFLANPTLEADAIISTEAYLPVQTYLPVFHVHPLLNVEDVQQIKAWLLEKETTPGEGGARHKYTRHNNHI